MIIIIMMMMMMIIIMIIIAFEGANTYAQVAKAQSCANHVQHIERLSRATCRVPLGTKGQLSY